MDRIPYPFPPAPTQVFSLDGNQMKFEEFFAEDLIIKELARIRANKAKQRHDLHFLANMSTAENASKKAEIDQYFPPRSQWLRPIAAKRNSMNSFQVNIQTLTRTALALKDSPSHKNEKWALCLNGFIANLRYQLLSGHYLLQKPAVFCRPKEEGSEYFRALTTFKEIGDRVVVGQTTKYLRRVFDPDFSENSFAFRCGSRKSACPTHHDAVQKLVDYRLSRIGKRLYVAECDIMGFFDCVGHTVATNAYLQAKDRANLAGRQIDSRAESIFLGYLAAFSYTTDVHFEESKWNGLKSKWPQDAVRSVWGDISGVRIGIPQGGAMSCLIANLVLDSADRSMESTVALNEGGYYARYCDDMIVVHPSKSKCQDAFETYLRALSELKLPYHLPRQVSAYDKSFWKSKSKKPYWWGDRSAGHVPWVSFLGYQVHHTGTIRIRPSSIRKEVLKQVHMVDSVLAAVKKGKTDPDGIAITKIKHTRIHFRVKQRLINMSVGRIAFRGGALASSGFCWSNGFRLLREYKSCSYQLRRLDRGRERQLWRLLGKLEVTKTEIQDTVAAEFRGPKHYGHPYSYFGQNTIQEHKGNSKSKEP